MANQRDTWGQGLGMFSGALPGLLRMYMGQQGRGPSAGTQTDWLGQFSPAGTQPGQITQEALGPAAPPMPQPGAMPPQQLAGMLGPQAGMMGQQPGLLAPQQPQVWPFLGGGDGV